MGCLKRIFTIIVLILAFIGFKSIGGINFVKENIINKFYENKNLVKDVIHIGKLVKKYPIGAKSE